MSSITATVDNTYGSVTVVVDYTGVVGATGFGTTVSLTRTTPDGTVKNVRNTPSLLAGSMAVFTDTEAPINTLVTYTANAPAVTGTALSISNVIITGSGQQLGGYLKDPTTGVNDVPLVALTALRTGCETATGIGLVGFDSEQYASASGVFQIIGDPRPRVIAMARKNLASTVYLQTTQQSDITALRALLASGRPLLLQVNTAFGWAMDRYGSDYIEVLDVTSDRVDLPDQRHNQRVWSLPYVLVYAPGNTSVYQYGGNNTGLRGASWQTLKNNAVTWSTLTGTRSVDSFNRTTANGWGNDDSGDAWTSTGGAASDYSTTPVSAGVPGVGKHNCTSANVTRASLLSLSYTDTEVFANVAWSALPVGANQLTDVLLRYVNSANNYVFRLQITPAGLQTISVISTVSGVGTTLGSVNLGTTYVANMTMRLHAYVKGTTLRFSAFQLNTADPGPLLTFTDSGVASAGGVQVQSTVLTGGTVPRVSSWSAFHAVNLATGKTWLQTAQGA